MRRTATLAMLGFVPLAALVSLPVAGAEVSPRSPPVVDLHVDLSYQVNYHDRGFATGTGQYVAGALARGGVAGVVLPLFVPRKVSPDGPRLSELEASFERVSKLIPETPPYAPPGCAAKSGSVRTWYSFEGAAPLATDPTSVQTWAVRGVRLFGLVHTSDNALATSSGTAAGTPPGSGLTELGRVVVQRVFDAGGVVDVSHASDAATDEILGLARAASRPVVASHSNARAVTVHPRNLTDAQIRGVAATGGVVGVNFHSRFLTAQAGKAHVTDVVRHIVHLLRIAGAEHVAIGSDFEGDITPPVELPSAASFPRLAAALARAGVAPPTIAQVFGENALRVLCPPASPPSKK